MYWFKVSIFCSQLALPTSIWISSVAMIPTNRAYMDAPLVMESMVARASATLPGVVTPYLREEKGGNWIAIGQIFFESKRLMLRFSIRFDSIRFDSIRFDYNILLLH